VATRSEVERKHQVRHSIAVVHTNNKPVGLSDFHQRSLADGGALTSGESSTHEKIDDAPHARQRHTHLAKILERCRERVGLEFMQVERHAVDGRLGNGRPIVHVSKVSEPIANRCVCRDGAHLKGDGWW